MRSFSIILTMMLVGLPVGGAAKVRVVTTHSDLAALAEAVGGDRVSVTSLCEPTQDPHFVDARPDLMLALNRADLLVIVGLELETGWLPVLLSGARNPGILPGKPGYLDTSGLVSKVDVPSGPVDRSMGDLHPGGNPHFTRAPASGLRIASGIARRLSRIDPEGATAYRRNYSAFRKRLEERRAAWEEKLAPLQGTEVVGYHESWAYFAEWLGLRMEVSVEPKPGIPPDPAHVARLIRHMRADGVHVILQEEYYPDATSQLVAEKTGARLVRMPGGVHRADGEDYVDYVDRQVGLLLQALRGSAREESP